LKAYALSLCRNSAMADDLVQAASTGAMAGAPSFQVGSCMRAWLFTILRNQYFSTLRKRRREVEDADGKSAEQLSVRPSQNDAVDLDDTMRAMRKLPTIHGDLLMLLGPGGLTYDEAAQESGCAIGTIKSRAHRARGSLAAMLTELERRARPVRWRCADCACENRGAPLIIGGGAPRCCRLVGAIARTNQ
jgi:RNA polymerase sigma-70 factor (ECF subfamily)